MNFALASQGTIHAKSALSEIIQVDNTIIDNQSRNITWLGRKSGIQKNVYYSIEYQYLLDTQQYSLLLKDSSFLQFYFEFDNNDSLKKGRLAYYPKPVSTSHEAADLLEAAESAIDREDDDLYNHLFNWVELLETDIGKPANTSHLRFDYDDKVKSHCKSHLQFGAVQEFRVPSNCFPLPVAFVEMCAPLITELTAIPQQHLIFANNNKLNLPKNNELIFIA